MKHEKMPASEVLDWLQTEHPELHANAEADRAWVWIVIDLRGDQNKPVRESLKAYGFRFARRGHALPSGKTAMWGHSCDRPTRFKRGGGKSGGKAKQRGGERKPMSASRRADPLADEFDADEIAAAFA
jgi:hypothetical protein